MSNLNFISFIYVVLTYCSFLIFFVGIIWKIYIYSKTPMCVKIPLTPAPKTKSGALARVLGEVIFFKTLFKSEKSLWIGSYVFHLSFGMIILQHLLRHYVYDFYHGNPPAWYNSLVPLGFIFGVLMVTSLLYLLYRRFFIEKVKYLSQTSDYFILILLALIGIAGMAEVIFLSPVELEKVVKQLDLFFNQLLFFKPVNIPTNPFFLLHYSLVLILIVYIPFSKIVHFIGIFFSPTIAMCDDIREKRYTNKKCYRPTI